MAFIYFYIFYIFLYMYVYFIDLFTCYFKFRLALRLRYAPCGASYTVHTDSFTAHNNNNNKTFMTTTTVLQAYVSRVSM